MNQESVWQLRFGSRYGTCATHGGKGGSTWKSQSVFASTSVIGTGVSPNIAKREGRSTKPSAFEQRLKDTCNAAARGAVRRMLRPWLCLCLGGRRLLKRLVGARE